MQDEEEFGKSNNAEESAPVRQLTPTRIFLRGLAVSLPAILTVLILLWVFEKVNAYLITPATWAVKYSIASLVDQSIEVHDTPVQGDVKLFRIDGAPSLDLCGSDYLVTAELQSKYRRFIENEPPIELNFESDEEVTPLDAFAVRHQRRIQWLQSNADRIPSGVYVQFGPLAVPYDVYSEVARHLPPGQMPTSARAVYMEYVARKYLGSVFPLSLLTVVIFIVLFYFAGQFVSARIGNWLVRGVETQVLGRLPVVRNVYGSVKQVTDFVFTENQPVEYRRVAAVQYPRDGIWTIGFVTGESMMQIAMGAGEPCVAVLIPTSPMPMTGFTVNVPKSKVLDLDITVEQAMQFCISCGVLSPPHQKLTKAKFQELVEKGLLNGPRNPPSSYPGGSVSPPALSPLTPPETLKPDDGEND
ncbi:DUF502 domain-containing protein [Thalassoglobus sp. JC818]|uniref:DUF502 domain-containing protein n=1 Tax=Thalassoglobus sp. JC818 TaxID=3232136 RepID=UPI0034592527